MEVSFSICTEELAEEMDIDNMVEGLVEDALCDKVGDAVSDEILNYEIPDWCEIHQAINESMGEYAEAMEFITATDLLEQNSTQVTNDLQNEIEGLRDRIEYLEYTRLSARVGRLFTLTSSLLAKVSRRVHWHMPRR